MADAGKVTMLIPLASCSPEQIQRISEQINRLFHRESIGLVVGVSPVEYEPFTPETRFHGKQWRQIELGLSRKVELHNLLVLLMRAGVPLGSHLIYLDQMRMCGYTFGEDRR